MLNYYILANCSLYTLIILYLHSYLNTFQDKETTDDATHGHLGLIVGSSVGVSVVVMVVLVIGVLVWRKRYLQPGRFMNCLHV